MIKKMITAGFLMMLVSSFVMAQSKDETEVAATVETFRKAMVNADRATLDKCTYAELTYGHSGGKIETKTEFIENIISGKSDFVTINLTDQTIRVVGNTAIVRHTLQGDTNDNGKPGNVKLLVLTVWEKQKGQWKLLARQAVHPPQAQH